MATTLTASTNATTKVTQLYVAMFGRAPDIEGLNFWGGAIDGGQSVAKIAQDMFATTPARAYFPTGSTNTEIIQAFYVNVLGREPDAEGLAFWVARLDALKATGNVNSVGQVVTEIIAIVADYQGNTPEGAASARLFANKIEVAGFWVAENGSAVNSSMPIELVTADTASVNQVKVQILNGFGNLTLTLKESSVGGVLQPIRLTTDANNGGTIEGGFTTAGDDKIVAGRLELLHQAYIDGGEGYNILEVDAKGVYAQPAELINIQEVRIENLPNVYTGTGNGGYLSNSSYPNLADTRAASSEIISASHFNKVAVTANQVVVMVDGQPQAVSAGVYTAESLAAAINAVAGSVVAVVNAGSISVSGAEVSFRGDTVTQIQSGVFNSALINDLQIQVVTSATQESGKISIPAGLYTALELKNVIDAAVPGADIVTVDTMDAAVEQALADVQEAREDAAAARWVLDAAQARADLDDASDAYNTAVNTEQTATSTAASAADASAAATAALTSANAAVTAATNATIADAAVTAATVDRDATAVRVTTANNAAAANTGAAQTRSADAEVRAEDAREALDAVVTAIAALQNNTPAETQLLLAADQTVNGAQLAADAASAALATQVGVLNTALGNPASTAVQVSAAQAAVASAQGALAQANAELVAALQQRTDIALQIANGETKPDAAYLNLQALQNDYAQAQGEAAEARNALNVALAEQAAIAATGVRENGAADAAWDAANIAKGKADIAAETALRAALDAYNAANPGTDTDLATVGASAAATLAAAQQLAISTGSALTTAQAALAAARQEVIDAFAALEDAQANASAANAAAARELVRADANVTDQQIATALGLLVPAAQQALSAALADLLEAEGVLSTLDPAGLLGRSGSVVISTNGSNAPELRFYGAQALEFGLSDIAFNGTLTIPARNGLSVIDLTRAMDIEKLVITEGSRTEEVIAGQLPLGALTIVGVRNGATLRLEGGFTQDVNVSYGAGRADGTPLTLELVSGDWDVGATLNLLQNTDSLRIMSLGGGANSLNAGNLGGELVDLYVGGNASLRLVGDLNASFANEYAKIDAGANLGGVSLTLSGTERVEIIGSAGNDVFIINTPEGDDSVLGAATDDFVSITGGTGNNQYDIDSARVEITNGSGNNLYVINATESNTITSGDGRNTYKVDANVFSKITAGNGNQQATVTVADGTSEITVGAGNHLITATTNVEAGSTTGAGHNTVTAGAGNGRFIVTSNGTGNATVTTGAGNSNFDVSAATGNATVTTGNGNSRFDVDTINGNAVITAGNGDGTFNVQAGTDPSTGGGNVFVVVGNGNSTFDLDAYNSNASGVSIGGAVSLKTGDGNLRVDVTSERGSVVEAGNGNSNFNINSVGVAGVSALDGGAFVTMNVTTAPGADGRAVVQLGNGSKNITVNADVIQVTTGANSDVVFDLSGANTGVRADASGTSAANMSTNADLAKEIVLSVGGGNNSGALDAQKVTINAGNGVNQLNVDGIVVNATLGNGNNLVQMRAVNATTTLGDGNNTVNLRAYDSPQSVWTYQDQFDTAVNLTAGNGANTFNLYVEDTGAVLNGGTATGGHYLKPASINIVAGNGGNTINIPDLPQTQEGTNDLPQSALTAINITTGTGNDKITVAGADITIKSGGGRDVITIVGNDADYTGTDNYLDDAATNASGAKLDINTGTGSATINLGASLDVNHLISGTITAKQGSVITGSDITLFVNTAADLRAASLTGITRVILDDDNTGYNGGAADGADSTVANNAVLTLTDRQFLAIGADNFSVDGAVFNTHAIVRIVVTQSTSLTALGVDDLPSNVDLQLEIKDGVTLTMTAQQLHERVMAGGVYLGDKDINDKAAGKVIIDGAGSYTDPVTGVRVDFDPFNSSDVQNATYDGQAYVGGSLSSDFLKPNPGTPPYTLSDWYNVTVPTKFNGYVRPIDVTARQYIVVDTTNVSERTLTSDQITTIGDLFIIGTGDFTMAKDVEVDMGPNFLVDFSALEGKVNNFTLANFQEVGQVRGNSLNGYEAVVNVMLTAAGAGNLGVTVGDVDTGLKISGVSKLVVVDIADSDATVTDVENATINLGSASHDLETIALRGNYNSTLTLNGVSEGTVIELQGDGFASRPVTPLAAGPAATSNVGAVVVNFDVSADERGVEATVLLNNQGVATARDLRAYGVDVRNVDTLTILVQDGDAVFNNIVVNDIDSLIFSSAHSVAVSPTSVLTVGVADTAAVDAAGINLIDASEVTGTFDVSLAASGATQNLNFAAAEGATTVTLTTAFTFDAATVFSDASTAGPLTIVTGGDADFQKANIAGVDAIKLADGDNVTLTWAQLDTLGEANISRAGTASTDTGTVTVIDWNGGAIDTSVLGTGITASLVVDSGTFTLDPAANLSKVSSITFADQAQTVAPQNEFSVLNMTGAQFVQLVQSLVNNGGTAALTNFLASGRDQLNITGLTQAQADTVFKTPDGNTVATFSQVLASLSNKLESGAGTITLAESVNLGDSAIPGQTPDETGDIEFAFVLGAGMTLGVASAVQANGLDVTGATGSAIKLLFPSLAPLTTIDVSGYNVDILRYQDLLVVNGNTDGIFDGILPRVEKVMYNNLVKLVDQTVTLGEGTIVRGSLAFDLITAQDDTELEDFVLNLQGGTRIEGGIDLQVGIKREDLIQTYLKTLTINSTGTLANPQTGKTANIVEGVITAAGEGPDFETQNELLSVTINATQALELQGGLVFTSVINDDEVATLNVTGSANVTIGTLNTADDDVDGLTVTNNGTGVLTLTLDGAQLDGTDALRFVGTGRIDLIVGGNVNLSNDVITAVDSITLKDGATLQLSIAQVLALGAANIVPENDDAVTAPTLVVSNLSTEAFDSTAVPDGVDITVIMAPGAITLASVTNLRDITTLIVNDGTTLTMTATQATQLVNEALTTGTAPNQVFTSITFDTTTATGGTINVTDVGQSHLDGGLAAVLQGMGGSLPGAGAPFLRGTIEIVEDVKLDASTLNAAAVSGFTIIGNGAPGLRVDVTMDAANLTSDPSGVINDPDLGLISVSDANANVVGINRDSGVKSTGISTYVVTALSAQTDVFYVCNDTVGLTTLGLQGNGDDTIYFGGVKRGVTFLLEGDGVANWSDVEKIDDTPDVTEIGSITAAFYTPNNPSATVLINNQGVVLGASSTGGERVISTGAVTINNALTLNLQVQDGDAIVAAVAGNQAETLNLTAVEDLTITAELPAGLDTINATGVTGLFKATISDNDFDLVTGANADITITDTVLASTASIDGSAGTLNLNIATDSDLSAGTLISVETLKIASGVEVTLSAAQVAAIGEADITGVAGGSNEVLNITGLTGAITINEALLGTGVVLGTVTLAAGTHTLTAGTDLTGASLVVPAGSTLTLTADQYMALADLDGIAPVPPATAAVIHITGLTQAHIDAGFTLDNVSNVNFALSDVALAPAATTVNLDNATDLNGFGVILSANQTLGLANSVQADGLRIAGDSTNTVVFRFDALDAATVLGDSRIDTSKYSIGTLRAMDAFFTDPSALNGEENAEFVIKDLSGDVTLVVYTDPTLLGISGYNRTVIVEAGVTVPAEFVFNDTGATRELIDLTITLQGGAEINGDLRLPTSHVAGSGARFFDDLVINSTGAAAAAGNVIDGDITPLPETSGAQNPTSTTERENNLLKVTIAGDKALVINGDIVFNKVGDNDAATTNNNGAATLTVTSTAAVTVGALDTADNDVTSLTVSNTGGATLSLTIDAAKIDAADALSFTGDNIALTVLGNVDLSNDTLTGLDTLTIGQGATLTLSQAQLTTLGAANLLDGGLAGSATLNLNGVNAAFDASTIAAGIDVQTLTLAGSMDFAATASNLTGVDTIVVPAGATLTLTAAQFQQLAGSGTISAAGATVNITGLTQADIDSGAFDTSLITAGTITLSLAGNVNLSADDVIENVTSVILANGQTLGLATADQADDLNVAGGTNTTLVFQFVPMIAFPGQINAAGYNVTTLKALAAGFTAGGNSNVEYSIDDLPSAVELRLYEDPELLGFLSPTMRKVVIEAGITTPTGLVFNDWDANDVVSTLSLTLEGGVELNGNLSIPTRTDKTADTEPLFFSQLTLISSGTQPNVIDGNISTATVLGGLNTSENNLVNVAINGTQALTINGDITFNKVGNNAVGGGDDATAVLNVNSSAAVTMGAVNTTDDDVTGLTVNNTGAGTLSLTVDAAKIDAADALSFTGDNIALTVNGNVDLSNDNLAGVNTIAISDNSTLTVTQAQFDALGAANFGTDGSPVAVNIVITEFGAAPFDATDLAAGINVQSLVLAASPAVITLDPATNLTDVDQIVVPAGSTLRLTVAQFQQLQGEGTIVSTGASAFNVEIYDVRQANVAVDTDNDGVVDAGDQVLNLGSIGNTAAVTLQLAADATTVTFGSFTSTGVSAPAFASDLFVGTSANLASIQMGNSQSVVFVSAAQADGIRVTGGTNSNVVFAFDDTLVLEALTGPNSLPGNGIDASLYNVTNLRALNVFVDGRNVEQVVENLPGVVNLVVYENPEDVAVGFRSAVNRTVIIEAGVAIDDFVAFIDLNTSREIRNLTIQMQGGTEIDGDVRLATMPQASPTTQPRYFDTLTIASTGATGNLIDGDITAQPASATPSQVGSVENNLLNVVVSGTQNLVISGDIVFSKVGNGAVGGGDDAVANLTITNTGTTTISQLDVSDNDLSGLTIVNNGGLLTVTGASPAVNDINAAVLGGAGANLETLTLSGTGNITFGLNPNVVTETGIDLGNVSNVNASALSGNLNLGEVTNIDNANFSFTSGTGVTTLTLTSDTLLESALTDIGWNFNFANAAAGSAFHLGSAAGSTLDFDNGGAGKAGSLTINLGNNTTLFIDEDTNLTDVDLSILQSPTAPAIVLADGVTLTLTAAQASGLRIVAGTDVGNDGFTGKVQIVDLGDTSVDLSGIAANIAGTITLEDNDVSLAATTNLGAFSITLNSLVDSGSMDLSGQTIRFATQVQADGRTILVTGDADNSAGVNSTNVVWLFNSVTGPLDTGDYSGQIGRLWMTQALLSGANVEQLFTTLPNTIVRSEFTTLTELDGFLSPSQPVDRIVELVAFTNLPNGMVFNDTDALEGIRNLTLNLGGQVTTGNISIDDAVAVGTDPTTVLFNELTINSYRALHQDHVLAPEAYVNDNDGLNEVGEFVQPQNINTVGNIRVVGVTGSGIDLLTVNLDTKAVSQNLSGPISGLNQNAGANLVVGTITFDSAAKSTTVTAELNVAGANSTTVASLDASDADIDVMVISNSGPGALTITGASPAVGLGTSAAVSNVEELAINATGNITLGTQGDADKPGVVGDDLSRIEVNGAGIVNLGVIALVDGSSVNVETPSFLLNGSGKANTFAVFGEANVGGVPTAPVLQATGSWEFRDVTMTFTDDVVLGAGTVEFNNVALTISGNVNFTTLSELTIDNTDVTIEVPAGSSLTILAEDADGLTITGDGLVTVLGLEDAVGADLSNIMTNTGDTGTLSVIVDTADGADVDALPDTVVLDVAANLGKAQVSVIGGGTLDVTNVLVPNLQATWNHDGLPTSDITVKVTFNVAASTTLLATAAQGDERTVTGAGTTNVQDIGVFAGANDLSLAGVVTTTVNIAVDTSVTLNSADNLGAAGPGRVTTIGASTTLTAAGSVVNGQYITSNQATAANTNGKLIVDDENTLPVETPITADLRNVSVEFIELAPTALVGTIQFPVLYGDPVAKYGDATAIPPVVANPNVAVQTVTLTAVQASGQTIVGANGGTRGEVVVNDLGNEFTNLSNINAGVMTAHVTDLSVTLDAGTDLGTFDVVIDALAGSLTLTAAQADGIQITESGFSDADVIVTALELTPNADLSKIDTDSEAALLNANGGVTLGANLGANMTVQVSDGTPLSTTNVVTFTGQMDSAETTFHIMSDNITLVFDANDAHELTVSEFNPVAGSSVIVNNVDGDLLDLTNITADTLVANVPADTVLNAGTDFGDFNVALAEGADLTMTFAQFLEVGLNDTTLQAGDFTSAVGGAEEIITVTGWTPATALDTSVLPATLALVLQIDPALAAVPPAMNTITVAAGTNLSGVEEIVIPAGVTLNMTADQFEQIQHSVTVTGAGTLNITNLDSDNADIDLSSVTAVAGTISLESNLADAAGVATKFELSGPLVAGDSISVTIDGTTYSAAFTTSHGQALADFKTALNASGDFAAVVEGNTVTIRPKVATESYVIGTPFAVTHALAGTAAASTTPSVYVVLDAAAVLDNQAGSKFSIVYTANNQSLTLASEVQADGRTITDGANTGTVLVLGFTDADDVVDNNAVINASGFTVDNVWVLNDYLFKEFGINNVPANFEFFLGGLAGSIPVTVYDTDTLLQANLLSPGSLIPIDRVVTVDQETTVQASVAFNVLNNTAEVRNLTLNLEGNSVIIGNLQLPQDKDPNADLNNVDPANDSLPLFFNTLTINSTNETGLATAANRITGAIFADNGSDGPGSESLAETFTLTLNPAMSITGNEGLIGFDGAVLALQNGWTDADVAAALAGLSYNNWTATDNSTAEATTFTVGALTAGQTVTIAGRTVTALGAVTAAEVATAFASGASVPLVLTVSGALAAPTGWTGTPVVTATTTTVTFTNTVNGDATNFTTSTGTNPAVGVATNGTAVVEFLNKNAGVVTNVTAGNFTFAANNGSTTGLTATVATTQEGSFVASENNLYNVVINADHDLVIEGELELSYVTGSAKPSNAATVTGTITVTGDADVTIGSVNSDDIHVTGVTLTHTGAGTVSAPGTSPGAAVSNTEVLTINANNALGTITLGTAGDANKPGVSGADLSLIDVNGEGTVNLGVIALVDTAAPVAPAINSFFLDATDSAGDVTATIGADLAAGGVWSFENGVDGTLNLTINADASFATGSTLNIQGAIITIDGNIDLSGVDLSGVQADCEVFVPAGSILTLTVEQVLAFSVDSIAITGSGTVKVVGDATNAIASDLGSMLQTLTVDLSGVTLDLALDTDDVLEFQNATATDDNGDPQAQIIIGSANDDVFLLSNLNDTVTGGAGNDTYLPLNGYYTYNVDAGTDTVDTLYSDVSGEDVMVVSAGATVIAENVDNFVATAATVINGTANLSTAATGGVIDMSDATGTGAITLLGGDGADTLVGGAGNDTINGGNTTQTSAADVDVLTGGAGANRFNFNLTLSSAATLTVATTQAAIDREVITFTADDFDDGTESITINYTVNGIAGVALINLAGVDVTNLAAITAAAIAELDAKAGIAAVAGANPGQVVVSGDNGAGVTIGVITVEDGVAEDVGEPVVDGLSAVASNGIDQAQISTITVAGTPTPGDTYSVVVDYFDGAGTSSEYTAQPLDNAVSVAEGLDDLVTEAIVAAENTGTAVVTFTSVSGDTGGFTLLTDTTAAFAGSGASDNGAVDYLTADIITDFDAAVDTISFGLAAGNGAINGNYVEAAAAATYTLARDAANNAFDGTVQYYLTSVADLNGTAGTGQLATGEEGGGLLFFDANLDGNVDGVVVLLGVTNASFAAANIVA